MGVDHVGEGALKQEIGKLWRELRRVAKTTMQNSAIGRAGLRIYDGGWLRIENGGLQVTGTASVSGTLTGSGTFTWTGPMNLQGAQSVTGPTTFTGQLTVNGPWDLNGNGDITGDVNLTGDLNVVGTGRVKVGTITINPAISGGAITFGNGAQVFTDGGTIQVFLGNGVVQVSNSEAKLQVGGTAIRVQSGSILVSGMSTRDVADFPGGFIGALVYDAGEMKRLV